jgi:hypothetical protein
MDDTNEQFSPPTTFGFLTKTDEQIEDEFNKEPVDDKEIPVNPDQTSLDEIVSGQKGTLYKRMFSKMEAGSLRGSIFAMSSLALGTGCLTLPQKFEQMGFITGLVILIFGAVASYWSLTLLIKACAQHKVYDYSLLVQQVWGKVPAIFLNVNILFYILGILISYQCISKIALI